MLHYCSFNLIIIHVRERIDPIEHEEDNVVSINESFEFLFD
jgi:hypothetical protein